MIEQAKADVAKRLERLPWPVYLYRPWDMSHLPCLVVSRPTVDNGSPVDIAAAFLITVPVLAIGRTYQDEDSQVELDAVADAVIDRFIDSNPIQVTAESEAVGGLVYPAFQILVSVGWRLC
jgi:hypothetical protein